MAIKPKFGVSTAQTKKVKANSNQQTSKSGASRSVAGKVGTFGKLKNKTLGKISSGKTKTASQLAAAKRNLEKARVAAKRKAGGMGKSIKKGISNLFN
jgi:hypothetical protein